MKKQNFLGIFMVTGTILIIFFRPSGKLKFLFYLGLFLEIMCAFILIATSNKILEEEL